MRSFLGHDRTRFPPILILIAWHLVCSCRFVLGVDPQVAKPAATQPSQPNVILILTDDHGYGDVSIYGATDVRTPNIDQLAKEGMLFTAMRANATVCSPSRAALLTGRFPDRVGVPGVIRTDPRDSWGWLDPSVPTLANRLKSAGYHTGHVGKWHLGLEQPNVPNDRGFDHFHGFLGDMMDDYMSHRRHGINYLRHNRDEVAPPEQHATELFTEWAIDYLRQRVSNRDEPFFLYLAYNAPHFPIQPPTAFVERVRARAPDLDVTRAANVAFVEHLDDQVGRVLTAVKELGLDQQTMILFTSDNGGSLPHGQSNHPWRDGKQSHYDGGLRVPFVVRWPVQIRASTTTDYRGQVFDIYPTLLELAGIPREADVDAVSLVPTLRGESNTTDRELYFVRREGGPRYGGKSYEALIHGDWKLMQNSPFSPLELYNLKSDPQEQTNLAIHEPERVRELTMRLQFHVHRGGTTVWQSKE